MKSVPSASHSTELKPDTQSPFQQNGRHGRRSSPCGPDSNRDRHGMCPLKTGREPIRFRALWLLAGVWDECRIHQPTLSISDSLGDFYFSHARDVIDTKITEMLRSPTGVWRDGQF